MSELTNNELLLEYLPFMEELKSKWSITDDCMQLIYLDYLLYDNAKLNEIHIRDEMRFWITRFIKNYWFSKTSRYYTTYNKYYKRYEPYPEEIDGD